MRVGASGLQVALVTRQRTFDGASKRMLPSGITGMGEQMFADDSPRRAVFGRPLTGGMMVSCRPFTIRFGTLRLDPGRRARMWYQRLISWLRSLFVTTTQAEAEPALFYSDAPTLPLTAPLRPAAPTDDPIPPPPPAIIDFPSLREPPTTVPLARLTRPSEPLTGNPASGDSAGRHLSWIGRESAPSSQPLIDPLQITDPLWTDSAAEAGDLEPELIDEQDLNLQPGSELYRRLMILRRLVRQGIYNEGFARGDLPEQYRRNPGTDDLGAPFDPE